MERISRSSMDPFFFIASRAAHNGPLAPVALVTALGGATFLLRTAVRRQPEMLANMRIDLAPERVQLTPPRRAVLRVVEALSCHFR
jgi:hypothetical protein